MNLEDRINQFKNELSLYVVKNMPNSIASRFVAVGSSIEKEIENSIKEVKRNFKSEVKEEGIDEFIKLQELKKATKDGEFMYDNEQMKSVSENIFLYQVKRNPIITSNTKNLINKWEKGEQQPSYQNDILNENLSLIKTRMKDFITENNESVFNLMDNREKTYLEKPIEYTLMVKGGKQLNKYLTEEDKEIIQYAKDLLNEINKLDNDDLKYEMLNRFKKIVYLTLKSYGFEKEVFKNTAFELYKVKEINDLGKIFEKIDEMNIFEKMQIFNKGIAGIPQSAINMYKEEIENYIKYGKINKEIADLLLGFDNYENVLEKYLNNEEDYKKALELIDSNISQVNLKEIREKIEEQFSESNSQNISKVKEIVVAIILNRFLQERYPIALEQLSFKNQKEFFEAFGGDYVSTKIHPVKQIKDIKGFIEFTNKLKTLKDENEEANNLYTKYKTEYSDLDTTLRIEKRRAEFYSTVKFIKDQMKIIEQNTGKYVPDRVLGKLNYKLETYLINTDTLKLDTLKYYKKFIKVFREEINNFDELDNETKNAFVLVLQKIAPKMQVVNIDISKDASIEKIEERIKSILEHYRVEPEVEFTSTFVRDFNKKIEKVEESKIKEQTQTQTQSKGMSL